MVFRSTFLTSDTAWARWARRGLNAAGVLLLGAVVYAAGFYGLQLRASLFEQTAAIRYRGDISNGFRWGTRVMTAARLSADINPSTTNPVTWPQFFHGFVHIYAQFDEMPPDSDFQLDYTPARLLVMSTWVKIVQEYYPVANIYRDEMAWPLLRFNTGMEAVGALAMFGVVRLWKRRAGAARWPATLVALVAAMIFWFNPSTLLDAHVWPQWDVWLVPFFLLALLLASVDWFFCAGMLLVVGAMLKGQLLLGGMPVLLLWPLFGGRVFASVRALVGFAFAAALCVSPWLVPNDAARMWVLSAAAAAAVACLVIPFALRRLRWRVGTDVRVALGGVAVLILVRAFFEPTPTHVLLLLGVCVLLAPVLLPRRALPFFVAAVVCAAVYLSADFFDGSWAWYRVGYEYPTRNHEQMMLGRTSNLAAVLRRTYYWDLFDPVTFPFSVGGRPFVREIKTVLPAVYFAAVVACAIAAAVHSRRNDPRTLVALTAPWVLMFALLPMMHERYLTWAAAVCGVGLAVSLGLGLLHWAVIALSSTMILHTLLERNFAEAEWPVLITLFRGTHPGIGWMTLLLALIYLYEAVKPASRRLAPWRKSAPGAGKTPGAQRG